MKVIVKKNELPELIKDIDKLRKRLKGDIDSTVTYGIHREEGSVVHASSGEQLINIAAANHWGDGDIPARPFVQMYSDFYESRILDAAEKILIKAASNLITGKSFNMEDALEKLALEIEDEFRIYIGSKPFEPNAPSTINRKGFDYPLFETGELIASIRAKVELGS